MKLLLHMCCGPCSCYPVKKLRADGIEPVGYFFNPNIHPYKEWEMRLNTAREFAEKVQMEFFADENYRLRDFLKRALPAEAMPNGRCTMCYTWRLEEAAGGWRRRRGLRRSMALMPLPRRSFTAFTSSMI